jgi:hypothetical protein
MIVKKIISTTDELEGIKQISEALGDKTPEQKIRMLQWAADKFCRCVLVHMPETKTKRL